MEGSPLLVVNELSDTEKRVRGGKVSTLLVLSATMFVCNANSVVLGLVISFFPDLSFVQSNALLGSPLLVTALLAIPASILSKQYGSRWLVVGLALVCGLALIGLSLFIRFGLVSFSAYFVLGSLIGCGGAILNAGSTSIMCWFPERHHGRVLGVFFFSYGLGPPVLGAYAGLIA